MEAQPLNIIIVRRNRAIKKIKLGLQCGWVISFPQGTTKAFAPIRKGTSHLITSENPIVVPVRINGFRRAFDKKGLLLKYVKHSFM